MVLGIVAAIYEMINKQTFHLVGLFTDFCVFLTDRVADDIKLTSAGFLMGYKETARFLGVVAQHNIYDFDFSVRDIVLMGRSPHKKTMEQDNAEDRRIAREALARVGLSGFEERTFAELSGGEQQRVILARALAQQTRALILDEPTNHLDVKYQLQLLNTVKSLDLTVVAAFHDLNLAGLYCDEIYVLKDGRVRAAGAPWEVLTAPLIEEVYGVHADILPGKDGNPRIIYYAG